jgi:hypothetical protein
MAGETKGTIQIQLPSFERPSLISLSGTATDDDTIKVAPTKKESKDKPNGGIKLKKTAPKHVKPGNWRDGSVIDGTSPGPASTLHTSAQY